MSSRKERLTRMAQVATESFDLSKDPYVCRNYIGTLNCRLCSVMLANEGAYLAHSQGKRHQINLARRGKSLYYFTH
jgi:splicing factor 3A subunit 2